MRVSTPIRGYVTPTHLKRYITKRLRSCQADIHNLLWYSNTSRFRSHFERLEREENVEKIKGAAPNRCAIMNVGQWKILCWIYPLLPEDRSFVHVPLRDASKEFSLTPRALEQTLDKFAEEGTDLLRKDPTQICYYARGEEDRVEVRNRVDYPKSVRAAGGIKALLAMGLELPEAEYRPRLSSVPKEPKSPESPPVSKTAGRVSPHVPKPVIKPVEPVMGTTPVKAPEGLFRKVEQNWKFFDGLVPPLDVILGRRLWIPVKWQQGPVDWDRIGSGRGGFDLLLGLAHLVNAGAFILRDDLTLELGNPKIKEIRHGFIPPFTWVDISELAA